MTKKIMLLAVAAFSAAMFALPAVASAAPWQLDAAKFPVTFHAESETGTVTTLTQQGVTTQVTCTKSTGTGSYENATTGKIELTFTGCEENVFHTKCTTSGKASGEITTTESVFHNLTLEPTPSSKNGILITPNAGHFASFTCDFGLITVSVNGTGIVGEISSPACGTSEITESTLKFASSATGVQQWMQEETTGTKYDLSATENGTTRTASQDGSGIVKFASPVKQTCP